MNQKKSIATIPQQQQAALQQQQQQQQQQIQQSPSKPPVSYPSDGKLYASQNQLSSQKSINMNVGQKNGQSNISPATGSGQPQQNQQAQKPMQLQQQQQQQQQSKQGPHPKELEKKSNIAIENAELNEYIKSYLKYNGFTNTNECFDAEINAKRMSSKLQDKKLIRDAKKDPAEELPRLYMMLKSEEANTKKERKMDHTMKILNQKYLEMLNAARSLFSISVKILTDFIAVSPQNEDKIDGYKKSIGQFRRLVLDEGKPSEKEAPTSEDIAKLKGKLIQLTYEAHELGKDSQKPQQQQQQNSQDLSNSKIDDPKNSNKDPQQGNQKKKSLKEKLVKFRIQSLETGAGNRFQYLQDLVKQDILDLQHINDQQHFISVNLAGFDFFVKHQLIALLSMVCTTNAGRNYFLQGDQQHRLLKQVIHILKNQERGSVTQRFCLSVVQKVSLNSETTPLFLEEQLHNTLLDLINDDDDNKGKQLQKQQQQQQSMQQQQQYRPSKRRDPDEKVHVFIVEYASATLTNLLAEEPFMALFAKDGQKAAVPFVQQLLSCLNPEHSVEGNKQLLRCLGYFTKDRFNQTLLETNFDERINAFLDLVSEKTDEEYKTTLLTYHATIFTKELQKKDFDMEKDDELNQGMKRKYDDPDESFEDGYDDPDQVIIFEHFNDELTDELLNGNYINRNK